MSQEKLAQGICRETWNNARDSRCRVLKYFGWLDIHDREFGRRLRSQRWRELHHILEGMRARIGDRNMMPVLE
eukprot:7612517-Pyramimonas_sp.AAC.1